jgi:putative thioredoxin
MEIDVNDDNFNSEVIERSKQIPVLVDFWAPWCGPCMILKPILENISKEMDKKFILAKVNIEENSECANNYRIMSIPAVKLFKNGKVASEFVGAEPESAIKNWLEPQLS